MIRSKVNQLIFNRKWKRLNGHNYTSAGNKFDENLVSVGKKTYGALIVYTYNKENKLSIGHYCSIGPYVQFVLSADHRIDTISTYPYKVKYGILDTEGISKGDIIIDDDVWIGANSIVLSGVHIGQGAIVGAGAVVNSDVPPYAIVGGVPAKILNYKFSPEIIDSLLKIDFSSLDDSCFIENINLFYMPLNNDNYISIINKIGHRI